MDWTADALYGKARLYIRRAHDEPVASALFGFWTSLALELLCRSALAAIHPVLLADPTSEANIQYVFGINPKNNPKSVQAKTVFARCSVFVEGFTDDMSSHCLIMADRRNTELHSGQAAFENKDNSHWLPSTYEVFEVVLRHLGKDFPDFLGKDHAAAAQAMLSDRRAGRKKEVQDKIATAKKVFAGLDEEELANRTAAASRQVAAWVRGNSLRRSCQCPACSSEAVMTGESLSRSPVRIDEEDNTISREVRVLPTRFGCPICRLTLTGFQELHEAGLGAIYTVAEEQDPIEFFGIIPEEHVDVEELLRDHYDGYNNE